jgi:hypothetical protein
MLRLAGNGDTPYTITARDFAGNIATINGVGTPYGTDYAGFSSAFGIQQIAIASVNQPGGFYGPLSVSGVLLVPEPTSITLATIGWLVFYRPAVRRRLVFSRHQTL